MTRVFETPLYPFRRCADQDRVQPARHKVIVVGAGPVGLTVALDLAQRGVPVVVLDENDRVSRGSRAICFAQRQLEILDRLGCGETMVGKGVTWNTGKVFFNEREVYRFDLPGEPGHRRPPFINLQQYHVEKILVDRLHQMQEAGLPVELRGQNAVTAVSDNGDHVRIEVETPEGPYNLETDWLIACDGANSPIRRMIGLDFVGRTFEDNFLIADVVMKADFPTERWFWFDPAFNPGQSALLHRQPDDVWRIDFQIGRDIDREAELDPASIDRRLRAMLGPDIRYELEWSSIYTFQCRRMEQFHKGRVIFAGDAAHQVSPFGARGANSGIQDADNLAWKIQLIVDGAAPPALLDSYDAERIVAADENILNSTRATEFITPKSEISRVFRDAVLALSEHYSFARPMVNTGRLSEPSTYDGSPLNSPDGLADGPARTRPGSPCPDAPLGDGFLLDRLGRGFTLLSIGAGDPGIGEIDGQPLEVISVAGDAEESLAARYLGQAEAAVYLIRPDQHVAARWDAVDPVAIAAAYRRATGKEISP